MQFFKSLVVASLAVVAAAQVQFTSTPSTGVEAGKPYTITWQGGSQNLPYTIVLRKGNSAALDTVGELTTTTGNSFTWTPSADLASGGDYALEIKQGSQTNFSGQFPLTGGSAAARPTASASAAASSAASAASAASTSARAASVSSAATASSVSGASASSASRASVASVVSSIVASASSAASAASGSRSAASGSTASATGSRTATGTASSSSSTATDSGSVSARLSSPLALVFGAVVAMAYLN